MPQTGSKLDGQIVEQPVKTSAKNSGCVILKPFLKVWKVAIIDDGLMQELNDLPKCKLWLS